MSRRFHPLRWVIWFLAVAFYFYEFLIRVAPSLIVPELMQEFHIGAEQVAFISAVYFYIYGPMQIPVGILADKFGARRLLTIAAFICGIGCILFATTDHLWVAVASRILIGAGSSFAFVGVMYVSSHWFDYNKWAMLMTVGNTIGVLGAVFGEGPISLAEDAFGWRWTINALGAIGIILSFIILLVVRNEPKNFSIQKHEEPKQDTLLHGLTVVCKNRKIWINAFASFCLYSPLLAFAGLWGVPFLQEVYHMRREEASFCSSMIFLGFAILGPLFGYLSDRLKMRKGLLFIGTLLMGIFMTIVTTVPNLPVFMLFALLLLTGFAASVQTLHYTLSIELSSFEVKGIAVAFTNFITVFIGSFVQSLIGFLLELQWDGKMDSHGVPIYSTNAFRNAMLVIPILALISLILLLFLKDRKLRKSRA